MHEFLQYHRRMLGLMIGVCLACAIALLAVMRPDWSYAGGFAAGAAAQLLKFGFLDVAAIRKLAAEKDAAALTQVKSMFLSLLLFGVAVVVVYKLRLNVWSMAAGIFLPRVILIADTYFRPQLYKAPEVEGEAEAAE